MKHLDKTPFKTFGGLSENLNDIMCGDYDDKIGLEYLEKAKHIGFLLSNFSIDIDTDHSVFDYEGIVIKVGGIRNSLMDSNSKRSPRYTWEIHQIKIGELRTCQYTGVEFENYLIRLFTKQEDFLRAYKMFERGYKINTIIS